MKIRLDVSSESSARQRIHMKNQAIFSSKDKSKKLKFHLQQFLFGALRVNAILLCRYKQMDKQMVRWVEGRMDGEMKTIYLSLHTCMLE